MHAGPVEVHRLVAARWERVWGNPATGLPWSRSAALGWLRMTRYRGLGLRYRVSWTIPLH